MNKGVFLCVGTGGHVLPAYNVIKSMLDQGIDKKNILIVTDERGIEYFKEKDFETIVYPFVSSRKGIIGYLLNLGKILKSIIYLYKSLKLCLTEPLIPKLPLYFENVDLISDALLFLLSVIDSTIIAIPEGPKPS